VWLCKRTVDEAAAADGLPDAPSAYPKSRFWSILEALEWKIKFWYNSLPFGIIGGIWFILWTFGIFPDAPRKMLQARSPSYDREIQRQHCKYLQRRG
jgi:hypothetical protein